MLTILSVAYPLFPVGPDSAGGSEQVVALLERGLVAAGHRSIVIAAEPSTVAGELIPSPRAEGEITDIQRECAQTVHRSLIEYALAHRDIDLIHFHGLDFWKYIPNTRTPMLATLHLPVEWYPSTIFSLPGLHLNVVSKSESRSSVHTAHLPVVPNGIDTGAYASAETGTRNGLLILARICPEKGVDIALRVAHRLDLPMTVAGPVHAFASHQEYFTKAVQPLLDAKRRYVGPVNLSAKKSLLAATSCVLIPSLAAETSSLVAMEAVGSGTPVIAFRSGALPEVVDHGKTGFIVDSEEEMISAVARLPEIRPEVCRETAAARFGASQMIDKYLALYKRILCIR